jgi:solute carrier family 25 protein 42
MAASDVAPSVPVSLCAGALAGALAKTTIAPLDRTKISFQVSQAPYSVRGALSFIRETWREKGGRALWRGNSATMLRVVPFAAVQFVAHEQFKLLLTPSSGKLAAGERFLAGSLAGCTATLFTYPLDLVRARMAVTARDRYHHVYNVVLQTVRHGGLGSLWKGIIPSLLGVIPYAGTSFFTYETLKQHYTTLYSAPPPPLPRLAFGAFAGLLGQNVSYPLDIVRRRMQTEGLVSSVSYRTIHQTLTHVFSTEGLRGLFKGVSMNWVKGPLAVTISFNTYDHTVRLLQSFL